MSAAEYRVGDLVLSKDANKTQEYCTVIKNVGNLFYILLSSNTKLWPGQRHGIVTSDEVRNGISSKYLDMKFMAVNPCWIIKLVRREKRPCPKCKVICG